MKKRAYSGANEEIVNEQITNYFFLSLFYCPQEHFVARFKEMRTLRDAQKLELFPQGVRQSVVLTLFGWNMCTMLRCLLAGYKRIQQWMRRA